MHVTSAQCEDIQRPYCLSVGRGVQSLDGFFVALFHKTNLVKYVQVIVRAVLCMTATMAFCWREWFVTFILILVYGCKTISITLFIQ